MVKSYHQERTPQVETLSKKKKKLLACCYNSLSNNVWKSTANGVVFVGLLSIACIIKVQAWNLLKITCFTSWLGHCSQKKKKNESLKHAVQGWNCKCISMKSYFVLLAQEGVRSHLILFCDFLILTFCFFLACFLGQLFRYISR